MPTPNLGNLDSAVQQALTEISGKNILPRIWQKDHTVWQSDPTEISNRLGWLEGPANMLGKLGEIDGFVQQARQDGFKQALLLGMGGSSLAPEVFRLTFGAKEGFLNVQVLDSTDPDAVLQHSEALNVSSTLFIVSTKSGGTVETMSFFKYFYDVAKRKVGADKCGAHFIAITDPGSSLSSQAEAFNFRKIFLNDPNIGGRFSVLSFFGLVPAALLGIDLQKLLARAQEMANQCRRTDLAENPGAVLGAIIGQGALAGRDKVTLLASETISPFGAWTEQLVAESTGKGGKGILPVVLEKVAEPNVYGNDRVFVHSQLGNDTNLTAALKALTEAGHPVISLHLDDVYDLGAEFFRWEFATAVAAERLQINPFDQPDVESAKVQARRMLSQFQEKGVLPTPRASLESESLDIYGGVDVDDLDEALSIFFADANNGPGQSSARSYVAIQAYLPPTAEIEKALQQLRHVIRDQFKLATTLGFGPRFLHSTGQLHKGDGGNGLFIQITADSARDAAIPDEVGSNASTVSFGVLKNAQALGDRQALLSKGRKVLRIHLKGDVLAGIAHITETM